MVETYFYLGCVDYVRPGSGREFRFAKVNPLLRSTPDRSRWGDYVFRPGEEFPTRGQIFWPEPAPGLEEGTYWQFAAVQNPTFNGEDRSEKYQVENPVRAIEIVDLRGRGDEATIRRLVAEEGIRTDPLPLSSRVVLHIDTDRWVGPLDIVRSPQTGTWKIAPDENLTLIGCWRIPDGAANQVNLKGTRSFLAPFQELRDHTGYVNWMSDSDLASGVLKRLRKIDRVAFEALDTTYAAFEAYVAAVEKAGLLGRDLEQDLGRVERVRAISATLKRNEALLKVAADTLLKSDSVREALTERKERFYRRLRRREQRKVENDLVGARTELAEVDDLLVEGKRAVHELDVQLAEVGHRIVDKREELERMARSYEEELASRLRELTTSPQKAFAEMAIVRGFMGGGGAGSGDGTSRAPGGEPALPAPEGELVVEFSESAEVLAAVADGLSELGFSPFLALYLHIAFLADSVPVLAGSRAYEVLNAYSSAVAGGHPLWLPISASAFEPQDLLGRFDSVTRRVVPHPGGLLAELTRDADDILSVVTLEGFNRAPIESYLLPLLGSHADARRKSSGRRVPLFAPGLVDPSDPFAGAAQVRWPGRTLLSLIPASGTAVLPVSPELWRHSVLIDTDRFRTTVVTTDSEGGSEFSAVRPDRWASWQQRRRAVSVAPIEGFMQELERSFGPAVRDSWDLIPRLYAAARACEVGHPEAIRIILEVLILPSLHKEGAALKQFLVKNDVELTDVDGMLALAASIMD